MSSELNPKRRKLVQGTSIICDKQAVIDKLTSPQDYDSWCSLYNAADLRGFDPILKLGKDPPNLESESKNILYHRKCRSDFTHKKSLNRIKESVGVSLDDGGSARRSLRAGPSQSQERVYEKRCIFCEKESKYVKGSNSREHLRSLKASS